MPVQRFHRLPQRLDYTLIPAPLNMSFDMLPIRTEKSPFPAVIVTPSSPCSSNDFAIAYLPPTPKTSVRERLSTYTAPLQRRARMVILFLILFFVLLCHFVTHKAATHFNFLTPETATGTGAHLPFLEWFTMRAFFVDGRSEPALPDMTVT